MLDYFLLTTQRTNPSSVVCALASPRGALQRPAGTRREDPAGGKRERGGPGEGRGARRGT